MPPGLDKLINFLVFIVVVVVAVVVAFSSYFIFLSMISADGQIPGHTGSHLLCAVEAYGSAWRARARSGEGRGRGEGAVFRPEKTDRRRWID